ncbi:peptidylprolyl isomerase [Leuconostoc citreum]|uniref:Peptidyl-prolyl cis-trans isomerase n=1 Tax=Leuconostoc citreum (strain KM20) TaxID=349519 RepID=B1MXJ8_LEUCK|nr:peptidylprolyl isomerase [Leuconostoc citreum]ACA82250.1 Peptidyl-prolyl cis-trans isomerase (rotamase) - cyclophilin family [Leuconostoc citreum KM20]MCS8584511.1 peptidylprolyl isomerase [Leuconostoc citreum]MCS8601787.1 peptidylprolyl isomerase [Leuconostoc citreum]QGN61251.1 peptidylprolyl isomerase [Leuconostoc citreum]QQE98530.1 peptidylprolyl isomerase [Leuconostoc citreum]
MTEYPQQDAQNYAGPVATFKTTLGDIQVKLFADLAPKTVENFVTHAKNGYYDNGIFHRVIKDFMVQGGDPNGTGMGGESIWGGSFEDEFSHKLRNVRGALSMANAGPNTNGSQFFIVQTEETPWLNGKHTVFGQVISDMAVVDKIAGVAVDMYDKPKENVTINTIEIAD